MTSSHPQHPPRPLAEQALLPRTKPGNALESTFASLLGLIKVGAYAPGERLPAERDLAALLGVSRTTLRSVLQDLQEAGFLEVRRGRYGGTFVTEAVPEAPAAKQPDRPRPEDLDDILRYRRVLELGVARLAAEISLSQDDRRRLAESFHAMDDCDPLHYRRLDSRFHLSIAQATGSQHLVEAMVTCRTLINDLLNRIPLLPSNLMHSGEQHRRLLDAILQGDPARAEAAAREHIEGTETLLRGFLSPAPQHSPE